MDFDDSDGSDDTTLTQLPSIPVADYDSVTSGADQPDFDARFLVLPDVLMWRLQYRNFGTHETLVGNFTIDATGGDQEGIRWFELRRAPAGSGDWTLFQEGTHAPGEDSRFMGSLAMDATGDLALGYTVSSEVTYPSMRYTGRLAGDPAGQMTLDEIPVVDGVFAQDFNRWGDYSSMNVDAFDGCTFWYTSEFVGSAQENPISHRQGLWATQIARFAMPECSAQTDGDGDGFPDELDNCSEVPNASQYDADLDEDGIVNLQDLSIFLACAIDGPPGPADDPDCTESDFDGDGTASTGEFAIVSGQLVGPPGPSGLACADPTGATAPCAGP